MGEKIKRLRQEKFVNAKGYPGLIVSNKGRACTFDRYGNEKEVVDTNTSGYKWCFIKIQGRLKRVFIHRAIFKTFNNISSSVMKDQRKIVHHKNENIIDNRPSNLKMMQKIKHIQYHLSHVSKNTRGYRIGISAYCPETKERTSFDTMKEAASFLNVTVASINRGLNGTTRLVGNPHKWMLEIDSN
jgi:hypothetical protein